MNMNDAHSVSGAKTLGARVPSGAAARAGRASQIMLITRSFLAIIFALWCGVAIAQWGTGGTAGSTGSTGATGATGISARLGKLASANFNSTADQAIAISATAYQVTAFIVTNCSATPTLAVGGLYTAASKGGSVVVSAAQAYSTLSATTVVLSPTIAVTTRLTASTLYLSLTTAAGGASTCDVYVYGNDFS
jgi:hypothetical protein